MCFALGFAFGEPGLLGLDLGEGDAFLLHSPPRMTIQELAILVYETALRMRSLAFRRCRARRALLFSPASWQNHL